MRKLLTVWLLCLGMAQIYLVLRVRDFFVFTERGQRLDWFSVSGNRLGQGTADPMADSVLDTVSVATLLGAVVVIGFVALVRRRVLLAVATTALVVGANVTSQLLKLATVRPDLGVDLERVAAGNSLPSGHVTVAASGHGGMPGMAGPEDMARLRELRGRDQNVLFCQLMIRHHRGGVVMADGLLARSDNRKVRHLAEAIKSSQVSEIDALNQALTRLGAQPVR